MTYMNWEINLMKNISVFGYVERDNMILLVRHRYDGNKWHLPGGSVEKDEQLESALKREFIEETGAVFEPKKLIAVIYTPKLYSVSYLYTGQIGDYKQLRKVNNAEIMDVKFFDLNNLPGLISDYARKRIALVHNGGVSIVEWR